ncbi:B-box zinc finger 22 [Olea europaea subsp. europaea]|uniref:B-box zinc finger 22 n=1 Tax=Olea europaea subsp. europaea TaxID=158383 RepID=A0A8S0TP68_OLEEU|nr:B-box zinc finger 22 [Olea europaea subsp. europaea]
MKIQCSVCEVAEANVLCCADEAALCLACDQKVHAANKLATKHQRVPLSSSSSQMPKCDICQETVGYFFCLEDRALLCRKCDFSIHSVNSLVSAHQRFLLTGVKVGLKSMDSGSSTSSMKSHSNEKILELEPNFLAKRSTPLSPTGQHNKGLPSQVREGGDFASSRVTFEGGTTPGSMSMWHLDDFLGLSVFNQSYNFMDGGSSKADSGKLGDSDCSLILRTADEELEGDECLGQVPDTFWAVPRIPSPPTASGLYRPKNNQKHYDPAVFVPDIGSPSSQNFHHRQPDGTSSKWRRQF